MRPLSHLALLAVEVGHGFSVLGRICVFGGFVYRNTTAAIQSANVALTTFILRRRSWEMAIKNLRCRGVCNKP